MKEKYITDKYPHAMIFGVYPDGEVSVCTVNKDLAKLPNEEAEKLVKDYNILVDMIISMAQAWDRDNPLAFEQFWYNDHNHEL